jgi:hypothetical protein
VKSCPVGNGFICEGARTESYGPHNTGIVCGSGAGAFDIFDQGTHNQHAIRSHNAAGDLTRRVIYDQFSRFSNLLTARRFPTLSAEAEYWIQFSDAVDTLRLT